MPSTLALTDAGKAPLRCGACSWELYSEPVTDDQGNPIPLTDDPDGPVRTIHQCKCHREDDTTIDGYQIVGAPSPGDGSNRPILLCAHCNTPVGVDDSETDETTGLTCACDDNERTGHCVLSKDAWLDKASER